MKKGILQNKNGFTVIEVVLVLAIAGLIFLMVFIAFPALARSQRDAKRRDDISILLKELKDFQTNNRGALPTGTNVTVDGPAATGGTSWGGFYHDYLDATFEDPGGGQYKLQVVQCGASGLASVGRQCNNDLVTANVSFPNSNKIMVLIRANCDGEKAVMASNPRKVALQYKLEGGGIYCANT